MCVDNSYALSFSSLHFGKGLNERNQFWFLLFLCMATNMCANGKASAIIDTFNEEMKLNTVSVPNGRQPPIWDLFQSDKK